MKITKYPQSCLMVETERGKILVDPGILKYKEEYFQEWNKADAILLTHWHRDHVNAEVLKKMRAPIYSTLEVQNHYPELRIRIISEKDDIWLDYMSVYVKKAVHGYNPNLKGGKEVLENVGYLIDDILGGNDNRLYVTSDTICFEPNFKADIVALPVTGYGLTMSSYEAALFAKELGAKLVLPIHMDNELYPTDLELMKKNFEKFDINYKVLEIEETIEI